MIERAIRPATGWTSANRCRTIGNMQPTHAVRLNASADTVFQNGLDHADRLRLSTHDVGGATVIDADGGLEAGLWLTRLCTAGIADVAIVPSGGAFASPWTVAVRTDDPVSACLASQYAGWPVSAGDFFAMGSGPMRLARGREPMLEQLGLIGTAESLRGNLIGVLESESVPSEEAVDAIADQCDVPASQLRLATAPSYSLAGTVQVVARVVETAMHKLHELGFDVSTIQTAAGSAPLPVVARRGDTVGGIGRTNDAILYGGTVSFWVDAEDDAIDAVVERVPSESSDDYGRPFAEVFKSYDYDFYKVDPMLFSPAAVQMQSLRSGRQFTAGRINPDVLAASVA